MAMATPSKPARVYDAPAGRAPSALSRFPGPRARSAASHGEEPHHSRGGHPAARRAHSPQERRAARRHPGHRASRASTATSTRTPSTTRRATSSRSSRAASRTSRTSSPCAEVIDPSKLAGDRVAFGASVKLSNVDTRRGGHLPHPGRRRGGSGQGEHQRDEPARALAHRQTGRRRGEDAHARRRANVRSPRHLVRLSEGGPAVRVFSRLARDARAWISGPQDAALAALVERATAATVGVPEARRADWDRLLAGFGADEAEGKRRARVEGLLRACQLFDREQRDARAPRERRSAGTIRWSAPTASGPRRASSLADARRGRRRRISSGRCPSAGTTCARPSESRRPSSGPRSRGRARCPRRGRCVRALVKSASLVPMRGRRAVRVVALDDGRQDARSTPGGSTRRTACSWRTGRHDLPAARARAAADGQAPDAWRTRICVRDEPARAASAPAIRRLGIAPGTLRRAVDRRRRAHSAAARSRPGGHRRTRGHARGRAPAACGSRRVATRHLRRRRAARAGERLAWVEAFTRVWQRQLAEAQWGGARAPVLPGTRGGRAASSRRSGSR